MFQSRNRESYLFKFDPQLEVGVPSQKFQSRNRESYLFKSTFDGDLLVPYKTVSIS